MDQEGEELMGTLRYRGVLPTPSDFSLDWVQMAKDCGLNLFGLHMRQSLNDLLPFIESRKGKRIVERAVQLGMEVECEIHAVSLLLPREHFTDHPDWFRMDIHGHRRQKGNLCPSNRDALDLVCANAKQLVGKLVTTTHRYYLWPDDGRQGWCHCEACRHLSDSDQNVVVMNTLLSAIRDIDAEATLSCLCYNETLDTPTEVRPAAGLFLEWAPIRRCYRHAVDDPACAVNAPHLAGLKKLLQVFDPSQAQVLEYWINANIFSRWGEEPMKLPFIPDVMEADVAAYTALGVRSITGFTGGLDADYVARFGEPPIREYGSVLGRA